LNCEEVIYGVSFLRKNLKWAAVIAALIFIGLQFTSPAHTNPPFDETQSLQGTTAVPSDVSALFDRSCNDCHSNKTNWRLYTYVAPVSWFTVDHVNEGRAELNFSEWGSYSVRRKETRLRAICQQCEKGAMPMTSYALIHPEVKLSPDQVRTICEWTRQEAQRLHSE
jgi:Haem-binding domain